MKVKDVKLYITSDGKEFYDEQKAKRHEQREALWNELHAVSDAGYGDHCLDDIVDYLMEFYVLTLKSLPLHKK